MVSLMVLSLFIQTSSCLFCKKKVAAHIIHSCGTGLLNRINHSILSLYIINGPLNIKFCFGVCFYIKITWCENG